MKKFLSLILASIILASFVSCGGTAEETTNDTAIEETEAPAETAPSISSDTLAGHLYNVFADKLAASPEATALELAETVITNEKILFMGGAMEMEEGFMSGFDNFEVHGFESAAMFAPMMGSIAFVGYVFDLADDADVDAFKKNLTDNANLRWQICVTADEMLCENIGDKVFFIMCPTSLEG